ncbi:MAG: phasin family protein [Pseudomonadota bacterium]
MSENSDADVKAGEAAAKDAEAMGISSRSTTTAKKPASPRKKTASVAPTGFGGAEGFSNPFAQAEQFFSTFKVDGDGALEKIQEAATEAFSNFETSQSTMIGAATELQRRSLDFVRSQLDEQASFVKALSDVKSPADAMKLQQDFAVHSMKAMTEQLTEVQSLLTDATKQGIAPYQQSFEKLRSTGGK